MKIKISVEIHKNGSENESILRLVGNVNNGITTISINSVIGYLTTRQAMWHSISSLSFLQDDYKLHISEDGGKTFTLTLEWEEVEELVTTDDMEGVSVFQLGVSETEKEIIAELEKAGGETK